MQMMMDDSIRVMEYELSPQVANSITSDDYALLLKELIQVKNLTALIMTPKLILNKKLASSELINLSERAILKLLRAVRDGYGVAFLSNHQPSIISILEKCGYVRSSAIDPISMALVEKWTNFVRKLDDEYFEVLVFGHDFSPAFLFRKYL
jgi:hypothetical protein